MAKGRKFNKRRGKAPKDEARPTEEISPQTETPLQESPENKTPNEVRDTSVKPNATASAHVLTTVELLEMILVHVPLRRLLVSQQVCKTWKTTIKESKPLQQALFFVPTSEPIRPFSVDLSSIAFGVRGPAFWATSQDGKITPRIVLNPVLSNFFADRVMYKTAVNHPGRYAALKRGEASWRKMLVSQPPVAILHLRRSSVLVGNSPQLSYTFSTQRCRPRFNMYPQDNGEVLRRTGLRIADMMPTYGFGFDNDTLRYFQVKLDTDDSRAWKHPRLAEVSLWLARYKDEGARNYQSEADEFASVEAAMSSLKLGRIRR